MFDRYLISPRPQSVTVYHRVTEQRAPTDESVRLLREMEDKARSEVLASERVAGTHFECVVHMMRSAVNRDLLLKAVISVNGKNLEVDHCADLCEHQEDIARALADKIAERLAREIVLPAFIKTLHVRSAA